MSTFTVILLCFQAFLVQNAFSQCLTAGPGIYGGIVPAAVAGFAPGVGLTAPYGLAGPALLATETYGGAGIGEVTVTGEIPVAGTTTVAGQVPILGTVYFTGELPASGLVTISGSCGCGCSSPAYLY